MGKKKRDANEPVEDCEPEKQLRITNGNTSKHDKKKNKKKREKDGNQVKSEKPTISVALPGSIIDNAQSLELATRLAGQIARALAIFRIDEVVVFDSKGGATYDSGDLTGGNTNENETGAAFLVRILRYLETPQYLRKALFPRHNSLRFVGMLPPLDAPHHLRKHEWAPFRDGVTLKERAPNSVGTLVDVGLSKNVTIDQVLEPGARVTVAMGTNRNLDSDLPRQVVSLFEPREKEGMYWGYKVRYASTFNEVFTDCTYEIGYDHLIGTSEHGTILSSSEFSLPPFRHLLIAFGGLAGLEECIEEDEKLKGKNMCDLFNEYLNICPNQGSRTIRTEEAIFICLQYFQEPINRALQRAAN